MISLTNSLLTLLQSVFIKTQWFCTKKQKNMVCNMLGLHLNVQKDQKCQINATD